MEEQAEVLVIGCGVIGLSTAITLQRLNFSVCIVSKDLPPNTTSNIAAAFWYPYKAYPQDRVLKWSKESFDEYYCLRETAATGVKLTTLIMLGGTMEANSWWISASKNFSQVNSDLPAGYKHALTAEVPVIQSTVFLNYLLESFKAQGGKVVQLAESVKNIEKYTEAYRLIVNCSGLGARELCHDSDLYPIRGQVVRTTKPATVNTCYLDEDGPMAMTYIVPRADDCILGGTAEENSWDLSIDVETAAEILRKSRLLVPDLESAQIIEHKVGLRPARKEVRLELEQLTRKSAVIHNYGHGGAGFTLAWGCAREVAELAKKYISSNSEG